MSERVVILGASDQPDRYAHRAHGGIGKATPFQIYAASRDTVRRIENEAALAVLLAPVAGKDGLRQVGKLGIRIEGSHYLAPGIMPGAPPPSSSLARKRSRMSPRLRMLPSAA